MPATLSDICERTGLSKATISRVINNSPLVKEATRERVQEVMDELDYHPLEAARALAGRRTDTLGVLSPYVGGGFFTDVLVGVDHEAAEQNAHMTTAFAHGVVDEQELVRRFIRQRRADAMILINLDLPGDFLEEIAQAPIPIVAVDTPAVEYGIPSVSIDNRAGAHAMMSHLVEHDYRTFVVFAGPEESYDSRERLAGCRAAASDAGISLPDENVYTGNFIMESGRDMMSAILDKGQPLPDAVVALNDATAFGAMAVLREKGLSVPGDIAVTGFDNAEAAGVIGLTTVAVPMFDMGREAARLAMNAIKDDSATPHVVAPATLVIRNSCGCTAAP
jgi:DNA-binding LacI/PurR family transcriptional regulator